MGLFATAALFRIIATQTKTTQASDSERLHRFVPILPPPPGFTNILAIQFLYKLASFTSLGQLRTR